MLTCRAYIVFLPLEGISLKAYDQGPELSTEEEGGLQLIQGVPHLCVVINITATKPKKAGKYLMGKVLGKGSFGTVRVGQNTVTGEAPGLLSYRWEQAHYAWQLSQ